MGGKSVAETVCGERDVESCGGFWGLACAERGERICCSAIRTVGCVEDSLGLSNELEGFFFLWTW